jgi:hypothetical protein
MSLRDQMMSRTKVARSTLLEPRFSPSNRIHSVHFENIGSRNWSAVAQAARILKLDFPMDYNLFDDPVAGVSDREPMDEGETDWIACSSRMLQTNTTTRLSRDAAIIPSTLCIPRT